jgi:hypothetical protein
MPEERPRHWAARQALAISPQSLSALLEAKHHEDDRRMAEELREAGLRIAHQEGLCQRARLITDTYELGRLLIAEAVGTLGFRSSVIAIVGEDSFLEVVASTEARIPAYQSEFLEEAFITGEALRVDTQMNDLLSIGNAAVPADTCLTAIPFSSLGGAPFGVWLFEGNLKENRNFWMPGFIDLGTQILSELQSYVAAESLLIDAALALATVRCSHAPALGHHPRHVSRLSRRLAAALGLGPSDVKRVGLLGALHELSRQDVEDAWRHVRHGKETGKAWESMNRARVSGGVYSSPAEDLKKLVMLLDELPQSPDLTGSEKLKRHLFIRIVETADTFEHLRLQKTAQENDNHTPQDLLDDLSHRCDPEVVSVLKHLYSKPTTY